MQVGPHTTLWNAVPWLGLIPRANWEADSQLSYKSSKLPLVFFKTFPKWDSIVLFWFQLHTRFNFNTVAECMWALLIFFYYALYSILIYDYKLP